MKHILTSIFDYIGNPDNFFQSVLLIMIYTLFVIVIGMALAWVIHKMIYKKLSHDNYYFDNSSQLPMRIIGKGRNKVQ